MNEFQIQLFQSMCGSWVFPSFKFCAVSTVGAEPVHRELLRACPAHIRFSPVLVGEAKRADEYDGNTKANTHSALTRGMY